jgi:hypothetical protein
MVDAGFAEIMRIDRADAESLLNGYACASVADALGLRAVQLQSFIATGSATVALAERLGMQVQAAEDFGIRLGKKGRIGLIVGMLLAG